MVVNFHSGQMTDHNQLDMKGPLPQLDKCIT